MIAVNRMRAVEYGFVQYHNQADTSTLHQNLVAMWDSIHAETRGRVAGTIYPENNKLAGGDPQALNMLVAGEIQFFTLMGGVIGTVVPVAEAQQIPFAFGSAADAHRAIDGPLGRYIGEEMAAKGLYLFPVAGFDNGMRQVTAIDRPIMKPEDLAGMKIRVPPGHMAFDTFAAFDAVAITTPSNGIYQALQSRKVDAQENPLAVVEGFKLYQLVKYVSMTNHMWSGFNLMAHLPTWRRLPDDIRTVIDRNVCRHVRAQRQDQTQCNASLRASLEQRGLVFNEVDRAPFRAKLGGVYAAWKEKLGAKCWSLLEASTGRLI